MTETHSSDLPMDPASGRAALTPEEVVSGVLLIAATLLGGIQVTSRTLIGDTFIWAEEAVVVMIVWSVFFGASAVTYRRLHIRVELLAMVVRPKHRTAIELLASCICLGYILAILYFAWEFILFLRMTGQINPSMLLPQWLLYLGFPLGLICMSLRTLQDLGRHVKAFLAR